MAKESFDKKLGKEIARMAELLKDIDMKLNHIIERLKNTYSYLNSINSNSK
ncbi:MAG: hypothetical protein ABIL44_01060 [candidate division WOR-3 bacterium]